MINTMLIQHLITVISALNWSSLTTLFAIDLVVL